jgi:Tfp pilus assembly protein PilF
MMMKQGKIDEATALVHEEQARWPSHSHTYVDLGVLAVLQGKHDEAIAWFTEALRWPPDAPDARHNLEMLTAEKSRAASDGAVGR